MNESLILQRLAKTEKKIDQLLKIVSGTKEKGLSRKELMEKTGWAASTITKKLKDKVVYKKRNSGVRGGYEYYLNSK